MLPWRLEMRPDPSSGAEAVRPGEGQEGPDWEGGGLLPSARDLPWQPTKRSNSRPGRGLRGESLKRGKTEARVVAL